MKESLFMTIILCINFSNLQATKNRFVFAEVGYGINDNTITNDIQARHFYNGNASLGIAAMGKVSFLKGIIGLKFQTAFGQASGCSFRPSQSQFGHPSSPWAIYGANKVYNNFKSNIFTNNIQLEISTPNKFKFQGGIALGVGKVIYRAKVNVMDAANQPYNFNSLINNFSKSDLNKLMDKTYESYGALEKETPNPTGKYATASTINFQINLMYKLNAKYNIGIFRNMISTKSDLLDGQNYTEPLTQNGMLGTSDFTNSYDYINIIGVQMIYKFY
jgi:hypothetical protein